MYEARSVQPVVSSDAIERFRGDQSVDNLYGYLDFVFDQFSFDANSEHTNTRVLKLADDGTGVVKEISVLLEALYMARPDRDTRYILLKTSNTPSASIGTTESITLYQIDNHSDEIDVSQPLVRIFGPDAVVERFRLNRHITENSPEAALIELNDYIFDSSTVFATPDEYGLDPYKDIPLRN